MKSSLKSIKVTGTEADSTTIASDASEGKFYACLYFGFKNGKSAIRIAMSTREPKSSEYDDLQDAKILDVVRAHSAYDAAELLYKRNEWYPKLDAILRREGSTSCSIL